MTETVRTAEQLRDHLRDEIASGRLGVGERLPSVRQCAADFGVAAGTAAKAYKLLEADGLVVARGRDGTRVAEQPDLLPAAVMVHVRAAVEAARREGVSAGALITALRTLAEA